MQPPEVLVFPREIFGEAYSLLPWESVQSRLDDIESSFSWLHRPAAERSEHLVQAIPCVIVRDSADRYCVFRRVTEGRKDLSRKLSLVIGGHADVAAEGDCFLSAMSSNLIREIDEEIGIRLEEPPRPVGVVIDGSSLVASRHVAFLHEIIAEEVLTRAPEEFASKKSKYTGKFVSAAQLGDWRDKFDPWSRLVIEEYVCPDGVRPRPRQGALL